MSFLSCRYGCADKSQDQDQVMGVLGRISDAGMKEFPGDHLKEWKKSK